MNDEKKPQGKVDRHREATGGKMLQMRPKGSDAWWNPDRDMAYATYRLIAGATYDMGYEPNDYAEFVRKFWAPLGVEPPSADDVYKFTSTMQKYVEGAANGTTSKEQRDEWLLFLMSSEMCKPRVMFSSTFMRRLLIECDVWAAQVRPREDDPPVRNLAACMDAVNRILAMLDA